MNLVEEGDKVQLECEAKLSDGTLCFKNTKENPLVFIIGEGNFFPVLEKEMIEMKEGETKTITLEPKDAFGKHNEELVAKIPKNDLDNCENLNVDSVIKMKTASDQLIQGTVTDIKEDIITVDFNHPLVDKKIVFTITINTIEKT
jgi:FKBP-type peptidyl-prolyl cis-trans isomerase 2